MDVRIGIAQTGQVIELELADETDRAALRKQVDQTLADESAVLWLTDRKGKEIGVPAARISFFELGTADTERRIGFGV
ncbi:MAG: DUF3107 domain-containing protein [Acidimicrobiales bacterium]